VSGFFVAVQYLTIVPVPGRAGAPAARLGRAVVWFPVVGALLGVVVALGERLASAVFPSLLAALLTLTAWKLVTGGLHLDGLADCLDGLVGRDREHRLAIMRDSRIGTFGAVGLVFVLMLELVAIAEIPPAVRSAALVAAPAVARAAPGLLGWLHPPARSEGLGAAFHTGLAPGRVAVAAAIGVAVSAVLLGVAGLAAAAVALALVAALGRFMVGRLGGITGDVHGAGVEAAELAVLLTVVAWAHVRP
jgi:adenosylcobinamide-GDP ribazoletransferase